MKVGDSEHDTASVVRLIRSQITPMAPTTATVFDHWLDLVSSQGHVPHRHAISPEAMATALSHVWLCDFDASNGRFRYRLAGEQVTSNLGAGVRGRYLDETSDPAIYPRVRAYFLKCVDLPAVLHITGRIYAEHSRVAFGERLMLPYAVGDGAIAGILGVTFRKWIDQSLDSDADLSANSQRHVYCRLGDGSTEVDTVSLS